MMSEPMTTIQVPVSLAESVELMICRKTEPLTIEEVEDVSNIMTIKMNAVVRAFDGWSKLVADVTDIDAKTQEEYRKRREAALIPLGLASKYLPQMIGAALWWIQDDIERLHVKAELTLTGSTLTAS